jgi:hypothetical protein
LVAPSFDESLSTLATSMRIVTSTGFLAVLFALPAQAAPTGPLATGLARIVNLPEDSNIFSGEFCAFLVESPSFSIA